MNPADLAETERSSCEECGTEMVTKRCAYPYWYCPSLTCGDPGHGEWVPQHGCDAT